MVKFSLIAILFMTYFCLKCNFMMAQATENRSNILWLVCEDISPTLSMYGDSTAKTPNLDELSRVGITYNNAYSTAGVCAPSRSSIITGMLQTQIGTMHMRTANDVFSWGKREYITEKEITDISGNPVSPYSVVVPSHVKCFPEYLRQQGYFCTNNAKTDYQFASPLSAWDQNNNKAHWRNKNENQPFFAVFNFGITHESRLWLNEDLELTVDPGKVDVPLYLQDTDTCRHMLARHYSNIELLDKQIGKIIDQLKEDSLYENTVIFFYSDHGGPFPRHKRELFDSGLKVPLIVKPVGKITGQKSDEMISFTDLAPTILSLAAIEPPEYMEGKAFLGKYRSTVSRKYIFAASDRLDECTDRIRIVRDERYLYVRNYIPGKAHYEDLSYRKNIPAMRELLRLKEGHLLNRNQNKWFEEKEPEELYDCFNDPAHMDNLVMVPAYQSVLETMRTESLKSLFGSSDLGMLPESQLIDIMWPGGKQPKTASPEITTYGDSLIVRCETEGASVSYRFSDKPGTPFDFDQDWKLYGAPIKIQPGKFLYLVAERIGFQISDQLIYLCPEAKP